MLNCKEVVKVISSEERRSWRRKLEVRFHLFICSHCSRYAKQMEMLKSGFNNIMISKFKSISETKIKNLEDRVIEKIKKNNPGGEN